MKPLDVLLVDDEISLLITLAANLELEGMNITAVENGRAALALALRRSFDLVLSDVRMPGMNGVELARELRRLYPELPILLMTAFAIESLTAEALQTGVFAVLPKPFAVEELAPLLRTAASRPTVLFIDDELESAQAAAAALQSTGLRCRAFADGHEALQLLDREAIDVCVIDHKLTHESTEKDNPPLLDQMKRRIPDLSIIMLAGPALVDSRQHANSQDDITWLRKPASPATLAKSIATARGHRVTRR